MHTYLQNDKLEAINARVAPRLRELYLCAKISEHMSLNDESFDSTSLSIGSLDLNFGTEHRSLTDPILDSGITMVRVMIQFLGFTIWPSDRELHEPTVRENNVVIESFGLSKLSPDPADPAYIFNGLTSEEVGAITETVLKTNDGVAHLTANPTKNISLEQLALACRAVIKVINKQLLVPLGFDEIEFSF
ncbi:hypothetical protein JFJ08_17660 [Vibrio atlanticus]|nr:hypothetical protein [Vibrio atlanticus]